EVRELGDLLSGALLIWCNALYVTANRRLLLCCGLLRVLLHLAAPGDEVDEDPKVGHHDDEDRPERLAPPGQVTAAEDIAEDDDQQPDPEEKEEEPEDGPEHLPGPELTISEHAGSLHATYWMRLR